MKLELGGGNNIQDGYLSLDFNIDTHPDFHGDFRAFCSPDFELEAYPDLQKVDGLLFDEIRAIHFMEHIEWIYQLDALRWIYRHLDENGTLEIETPNLEFIMKVYFKQFRQQRIPWKWIERLKPKGRPVFPKTEHPLLEENISVSVGLARWVNFKLNSGCGLNDYHLCIYDRKLLEYNLHLADFQKIQVSARGAALHAIAMKQTQIGKELEGF